jgi:hypothetical protein
MVGEIEGVNVKIKIDSLLDNAIVDLKIMKDMETIWRDGERKEFWDAWNYPIQGAIYREIVRQNTGRTLDFILAVATKEKPEPNIDLLRVASARLDAALEEVKASITYFDGLKKSLYEPERCMVCPYCYQTKVLDGIREVG